MKTSELVKKRWFLNVVIVLFIIYMSSLVLGRYLPYILTENSFRLRFYYLLPVLILSIIYFSYIHKWKETGKTGYEDLIPSLPNRKEKIKASCVLFIGVLFLPWGISWTASNVAASLAYLTSKKPHIEEYRVVNSKAYRNLIEVELLVLSNKETAYIRAPYSWFEKGVRKPGGIVKIEGRSSAFGTIVEKATRLE